MFCFLCVGKSCTRVALSSTLWTHGLVRARRIPPNGLGLGKRSQMPWRGGTLQFLHANDFYETPSHVRDDCRALARSALCGLESAKLEGHNMYCAHARVICAWYSTHNKLLEGFYLGGRRVDDRKACVHLYIYDTCVLLVIV